MRRISAPSLRLPLLRNSLLGKQTSVPDFLLLTAAPVSAKLRREIAAATRRMPATTGLPIRLLFRSTLSACRGKLLSDTSRGHAVHAAAFLRSRRIVLETGLLDDRRELSRILVHELFHFIWVRSGNARRRSWEDLLAAELRRHARGELGWSAEFSKNVLEPRDAANRTRRWREYACESFCDTGAWLFSYSGPHPEYTLAPRFRELRRRWLRTSLNSGPIAI